MALFGSVASVRAQLLAHPPFTVAFEYVADVLSPGSTANARLLQLDRGGSHKVELGGGVFAIEQVYETKPRAQGFFESHRKYIDVQVVVFGEELMEVVDAARTVVREAYAAERDLVTYQDVADASQVRVVAGEAAIFFPVDVHMPSLRAHAGPVLVRKTVVKVPLA